jgi:hypothetical protein
MDANRFQALYARESDPTLDLFLGDTDWRGQWRAARSRRVDFRRFLAQQYAARMAAIGYLPAGLEKMKEVRSSEKNLPLYHLAFFSKHPRGYDFWNQVLKYGTDQLPLFEEERSWHKKVPSNGPTPPGTQSRDAARSARGASIATPSAWQSGSPG